MSGLRVGLASLGASVAILVMTSASAVCQSDARGADDRRPAWLADFIDRLDPSSQPALVVSEIDESAGDDEIIAALASYFRHDPGRQNRLPQPLWVIPVPKMPNPNPTTDLADKALDHLITTRAGEEQFGDTLPWFSADKQTSTLSRFPHFDYLGPAYFHTRDERYARAMVRDMLDFVQHVPISEADRYHVQVSPLINPWNWVLLQWRDKRWMDALVYLRDSPSLSDEDYLRIVRHIWQEIDWLVPHKNLGLHNGTLGNLTAILYAALHFPEARGAHVWIDDAGHFFNTFLDLAFYPGEFLIELTLGYSEGTLVQCLNIYEAFPPGPLRDQMASKLERLVDAHVGMMKPDRSIPRYGDHGAYDITDRLLRRAARLFGRDDLGILADDPSARKPLGDRLSFPYQSDPYYLSGYYAMRDGWDSTAMYLSMDAGPFGTNHHHGDKLSITVSADGADFIVDPGTSLYRSIEPGPRIDLRPGYMHNVLTVDGVDPNTGWDRHYGFDVLENRWITNDRYDFLQGTYEFRNNLISVIWRRSVLFLKGQYWIVFDALLGEGTHRIESNLQFAIDVDLEVHGDVAVAAAPNGASLYAARTGGDGLEPYVAIGDTTFPGTTFLLQYPTFVDWTLGGRGWVGTFGNESERNPTKTYEAPALVYRGEVSLPYYSVHVLSPSSDHEPKPVSVSWVSRRREAFTLAIEHEGVVDTLEVEVAIPADGRTKPTDDQIELRRSDGTLSIEIDPAGE